MEKLNELVELADEAIASSIYSLNVKVSDILAIAEAFRALEQRVESEEAKLAELEKLNPIKVLWASYSNENAKVWRYTVETDIRLNAGDLLFTRPAPAVSLAELVPECFHKLFNHASGMVKGVDWNKGTAARNHREPLCIAVIECRGFLRNIEDAK